MRKDSQLSRYDQSPARRPKFLSPWASDFWEPTRLFDEVFGGIENDNILAPAIDIEETDVEFLVSADLPGIKKEDISIESVNNQLSISAERKYENNEGRKQGRTERFYGTYQRSFTLPAGVDAEKIQADYKGGVLTVHLPKGEKSKAKRIQIGG